MTGNRVTGRVARAITLVRLPLAVGLGVVAFPGAVSASAVQQTANVIAYDIHGRVVGNNPLLRIGDHVRILVTGFGDREAVQVRRDLGVRTDRADPEGVVRVELTVTRRDRVGQHLVALVEESSGAHPVAGQLPAMGNFVARIPVIGLFPFRVVTTAQSNPPSPANKPGNVGLPATDGAAATSGTRLPMTGVDIRGVVLASLAALAGGVVGVSRSRRIRG